MISGSCAFFRSISWTNCLRTRYSGCRSKKRRAQCSPICGGGPSSTCARRRTAFAQSAIMKRRAWSPILSNRSRYVQTANFQLSVPWHHLLLWLSAIPSCAEPLLRNIKLSCSSSDIRFATPLKKGVGALSDSVLDDMIRFGNRGGGRTGCGVGSHCRRMSRKKISFC